MSALSIEQKKEWAKLLYLHNDLTQKAIAGKAGVSEKTIGKWVAEGHWENLRKSLVLTKEEQLRWFYEQLALLKDEVARRDNKVVDSKDADTIIKLTAAINNLERNETSLAEIIDVGRKFIIYLQRDEFDKAKLFTDLFDAFIKEQLKRF